MRSAPLTIMRFIPPICGSNCGICRRRFMCGTISTKSNPLETHRRVPLFAFRAPFPRQPVSGEACVSGSQKTPCRGIKGGEGAYPVTTTAFELRMKSLDTSARHLRLSPTRNWDLGHRCGRLRHCDGGKKRPCGVSGIFQWRILPCGLIRSGICKITGQKHRG